MSEENHIEIGTASLDANVDFNTLMASLIAAGAEQFDPVRLHYIKVLAKRALAHQGNVKCMLDTRLVQALAVFKERFEHAQHDAKAIIAEATPQYPHAANALQQLFAQSDFKSMKRFVDTLKAEEQGASLTVLLRQLEQQHLAENTEVRSEVVPGSRSELKTIRNFRNTWAKLSVDKQVAQALEQAPKNAGPINSHMLVLRSLTLMRDISPDYLNRFISYADTLLCLDQGEKEKPDNVKKSRPASKKKSVPK